MSDLNRAVFTGRLGRDPEVRTTQSGNKVASFSLAVTRAFKNAAGERETDWIDCVAWRGGADVAEKYCHKGDRIAVSGSMQVRHWEAQDGSKRKSVECVVDQIVLLGGGKQSASNQAPPPADPPMDNGDDDLPF